MTHLHTAHGDLPLPAFLPDATRGSVRTVDADDLARCGVKAIMVNVLHLSREPGTSLVSSQGGIHAFMGWDGPVSSDSGGFQVYSLVRSSGGGSVSRDGFVYHLGRGRRKRLLTPEKCIQQQFRLGADIMFCLDHCTHPGEGPAAQRESVANTVDWARRCKAEFSRRLAQAALPDDRRPLLFAVVQGGEDRDLRRQCAESLIETGFDGFGFGGWPIDRAGGLVDAVGYVSELIPGGAVRHALGIGKAENVVRAFGMGYSIFDAALPTRDARRGRLPVLEQDLPPVPRNGERFYRYIYIGDERHARDGNPVDVRCDCLCCRRYSRAYVHHLFRASEVAGHRLATIHNLRFHSRLMESLRTDGLGDR